MMRCRHQLRGLRGAAMGAALLLMLGSPRAAWGKPPKAAATQSADEAAAAAIELPADVNDASLRISAMDTIYELDLSVQQLNALRAAATGTAATTKRTPGQATPQLLAALKNFQTALLAGKDDAQVAKLRNQVLDLANGDDVQLDNGIVTTAAARTKASGLCLQLKASQLAAYLAVHADEVSDPQELMMITADGLQDVRSDPAEKADAATISQGMIQDTASTVGALVAGMNDVQAQAIAQRVTDWLRSVDTMTTPIFAKQRQTLEDSAGKIVGNMSPVAVLNNWLDQQMAILLSNPQLPDAIDAILKVRLQSQ
jgi:hypothetical protein